MEYEIFGYKTQTDFISRNPTVLGYTEDKGQAAVIALMAVGEYAVVKMQSDDREEIYIIKRT